jgi:hypothetical protein
MSVEPNLRKPGRLPPTSLALYLDETKPYFLWWTNATVGDLKRYLRSEDPEERAYWMGALLREANTRDVGLFTNKEEIVANWPRLIRYLGKSRDMWAWLLDLPQPEWPPAEAKAAGLKGARHV